MTLYELTAQFSELLDMAQDGEVDEQTLLDTMEGLDGEIEEKADGYAKVIKSLEGNVSAIDSEVKRLNDKKRVVNNNIKKMKDNLKSSMEIVGKRKFKTDLFSFNIAKNGGLQPLEIVGKIPDAYKKIESINDTAKIRKALADGEELDFAVLKERGENLRIG